MKMETIVSDGVSWIRPVKDECEEHDIIDCGTGIRYDDDDNEVVVRTRKCRNCYWVERTVEEK